jgi:ribonuclease D
VSARQKKEPKITATYSEADIEHPELFQTLKEWRTKKAKNENIAHYQVLHQKTLIQITVNLPNSLASLKKIKGIGKKLEERYGEELVDMVSAYRAKHNIQEISLPTPEQMEIQPKKKKEPKPDTKKLSMDLFEEGLNLREIAEKRELVLSTIEGHMAHFVTKGELSIHRLLTPEKIRAIEETLTQKQGKLFGEIKQTLGDEYSYGEIKLVQAHLNQSADDS